jgi:hypothetical protein
MKYFIAVFLSLVLFSTVLLAQPFHLPSDSIYLIGDNSTGYSVVAKNVTIPSNCGLSGDSFSIIGNNAKLSVCYDFGVSAVVCTRTDTFDIGSFLSGEYNLEVLLLAAPNGDCANPTYTDTSQLSFVVQANGIGDLNNNSITLSPNPTTNKLTCTLLAGPKQAYYQVLSIDGKVLINNTAITQSHFEVDVSELASGVYYLVLQDDKERTVKRFVKY